MFLRKIPDFHNTLLFRLTFLYALVFIISTSITFIIFYYRIYSVSMDRVDLELTEDVEHYLSIIQEKGMAGIFSKIAELNTDDIGDDYIRIINHRGETVASTDLPPWNKIELDAAEALESSNLNRTYKTEKISDHANRVRIVTEKLSPDYILQLGESLDETSEYLKIFRNMFIVLIVILLIISFLIGRFLAGHALKDMEAVTLTAKQIANGLFDRRVRIKGRFDEIKRLGTTFNRMLDHINQLLKSLKETNDNIAHDLRSPIARIRGLAEMTLIGRKPIEDYREVAASTIEECDNLIEMINTMLDITEAEAGVKSNGLEIYDLSSIINEAFDLINPIAVDKAMKMKANLPESLKIKGDKKKMQRIIINLLENAIKYTPEGGTVTVTATGDENGIQLLFEDTGIGISETNIPKIFDRFYRCDQSRSEGGFGLGLSLAKAYIESMNGEISVYSVLNKGSIFKLQLCQKPILD